MKTVLLLILGIVFASSLAFAQPGVIGLYSDPAGADCNIVDAGVGVVNVYAVHTGTAGAQLSRFWAPMPGCMTGVTYLGDTEVFPLTIGDSQTGVTISYGACLSGPIHILTIRYLFTGLTPACCNYPVLPDPAEPSGEIIVFDCSSTELVGVGGLATINGDVSCPCGPATTGYQLRQSTTGSGGGELASSNYGTRGTVGQVGIGKTSTASYGADVGYWYLPGSTVTGTTEPPIKPKATSLEQNFPNPFNPTTTIRFSLAKRSYVTLNVYDVKGSLVASLVDREMPEGVHTADFDASGLASGVYFYRLIAEGFVQSRKLVLLK